MPPLPEKSPEKKGDDRAKPGAAASAARLPAMSPAVAAGGPMTPAAVLTLQRAVGNQAVARALAQEEHVHGADCGHGAVQRAAAEAPTEILNAAMSSASRPIESSTLKKAQSFYQNDRLSQGRVHTGPLAQRAVAAFGAKAMTVGTHIFFGAGVERDAETAGHEYGHLDKNTRGIAETGTDHGTGAPVTDPNQHSEREAAGDGAAFAKGAEVAPSVAQRAVRQGGAPFAGSGAPVQRATVQRSSYDDVDMEDYADSSGAPYIVEASPRRPSRSRSRNPFAPSGSSRHRSSSASSHRSSHSFMPAAPSREEPRFGPGSRPPISGGRRFTGLFSRRPERSGYEEAPRGRSLRRADSDAMDVDMEYGAPPRRPSRTSSQSSTRAASSRAHSRARSESRRSSSRYAGEEMDYEESGYGPAPSRSQQLFDRLTREARNFERPAPRRDVGPRYAPQSANPEVSRRSSSRRRSQSVRIPSTTTILMRIGDKVLRDVKKKIRYGAANQAIALNAHGGATTARLLGGRSVRRHPVRTVQERLGQDAAAAEASGTGNCGEHAAMSFCLLNRQSLPAGVMIWHVTLSLDHAFIAVGYPHDPRNIVIIDPWQNNAGARRADQFNFPFLVTDQEGNLGITDEARLIQPDGEDYLRRGRQTIDVEHLEAQRDLPDDAFMNIDGLAAAGGGLEPLHTWNHPMPPRPMDDRTFRARMDEERRGLRRQRARSTLRSSSRATSRSRWW